MATVEVKTAETRCDRCEKRVTKNGGAVQLNPAGVDIVAGPAERGFVDMCGTCIESIGKWWVRPHRPEGSE